MKASTIMVSLAAAAALAGCSAATAVPAAAATAVPAAAATAALTADETADLLYMREEEKLARDVYLTFADRYGLPLFSNIAASEQTHTDAIGELLAAYDISDPLQSEIGVFTNPALQQLYDELIARGSLDAAAAAGVGALVEEVDIIDLREALARTDHSAIARVYINLLNASGNHLNAFARQVTQQTGADYVPQRLEQSDYDALTAAGGRGQAGSAGSSGFTAYDRGGRRSGR